MRHFYFMALLLLLVSCSKEEDYIKLNETEENKEVNNYQYCNYNIHLMVQNQTDEDIYLQIVQPFDYPLKTIKKNNEQFIFYGNGQKFLQSFSLPLNCPTSDGVIKLYFWRYGWNGYLINIFELDENRCTLDMTITKQKDGSIKIVIPDYQRNRLKQ